MKVATFTSVEVSSVMKQLPFYRPDQPGLCLLKINVRKLHPFIRDEDAS
jgi:hypothetical protein